MEIGKKLKIIREAAGMNQAEVAEKAGISQGYYSEVVLTKAKVKK